MAPRRINRSEARRDFLKTSAGLGAFSILSSGVHASSASVLKIGLVGCGGRGTGAASQALRADKETELVAVGDMFDDRLQGSLAQLKGDGEIGARVKVSPDACFTGFDAYKKVIDSGVDVVLLASPPGFRPMHIEAAVAAGTFIMVATHGGAVQGTNGFEALDRIRRVAHDVSQAYIAGTALLLGVVKDGLKGFEVGVDISEDREFHRLGGPSSGLTTGNQAIRLLELGKALPPTQ